MRTFTSNGLSPQDGSWSTPVIVAQREDGEDISTSTAGFFLITAADTNAPTNAEFSAVAGRNPVQFDVAIVRNTGGTDSKAYVRGSSSWSAATAFIDGDLVVSGTIGTSQLVADSVTANILQISSSSAGASRIFMDGPNNRIDIFDSSSSNRLWNR